jgi:hypothetical protein
VSCGEAKKREANQKKKDEFSLVDSQTAQKEKKRKKKKKKRSREHPPPQFHQR